MEILEYIKNLQQKIDHVSEKVNYLYAKENCKSCEWFTGKVCSDPDNKENCFASPEGIFDCDRWEK